MSEHAARLQLEVQPGARAVITARGELDPSTAPLLDRAVAEALDDGASQLVIDLAGVTFMDSSGLRSLIAAHARTQPEPLVIRRPGPFTVQLLAITGLDERFVVDDAAPTGG